MRILTPIPARLPDLRSRPCCGRRVASLAAVLGVSLAVAGADGRSLALVPTAEVGGDGAFLDQLVVARPAAPLPHLRLAPPPSVGQGITLSRAEIADWLRTQAPDLATTNWTGPDRVRITRRCRTLEETEVKERLRETLQTQYVRDRGELELRLTRLWSALLVPDDPLTLRILDLPATGPSASFIVRFEIHCGEERLGSWQLAASAKIWRDIPVAAVPLRRGQSLAGVQVAFERRDVLALRDVPGTFALDDASLELVENIPAGQPILARSVRPRPAVLRGQLVAALVMDGPLSVLLKVEALEDGLPGQIVRIRNPRTRRELKGKVIDEETIVIPW